LAPWSYNVFEGQHGFLKRAVAYRKHHLREHVDLVPLLIQSARLNLTKDVAELIGGIQAEGFEPVLVILDTLNRSLVGSESKDADMAGYLAAADKLREAFHCLVLIVHHCGLEQGRPRGHTSLTGAADVQISLKRVGDTSVMTVEYLKDGEDGAELYSKLETVDVGHGKTSCVVVEADPPADERPLSSRAEAMPAILREQGPLLLAEWNKRGRIAGIGTERRGDLRDARTELLGKGRIAQLSDGRWAAKA
jgi:AAA domain-containing protein